MARAGDGKLRSGRRRATAVVSLRMTPAAKIALQALARAQGYATLAAWIHDRLRGHAGSAHKRDILLAGELGYISGALTDLARTWGHLGPDDNNASLHALSHALAQVQKGLLDTKGPP